MMLSVSTSVIQEKRTGSEIIKVAIIEDLRDLREGLAMLIGGTVGFECVGRFRSVEDAVANVGSHLPQIVLTDIGLPGLNGIEGIKILRGKFPEVSFIALTVYDDDERIFDALCAGACGYLLKNTQPARLLDALREVAAGGAPMSPEVARRVIELFQAFVPAKQSECYLTPQETELLRLLVEGHSYKTAAHHLGISYHTVSFHFRNVYEKLEVHSKSEAVSKALREKLV